MSIIEKKNIPRIGGPIMVVYVALFKCVHFHSILWDITFKMLILFYKLIVYYKCF